MARKPSSVGPVAATVTVLVAIVAFAGLGAWQVYDKLQGGPGARAERHLLAAPAYTRIMAELKQDFPDAESELRQRVRLETARIAHPDERKERAEELADRYVAGLNYSSAWIAPSASARSLSDVAATRLAALQALRSYNVNTCGRYAVGVVLRARPPVEVRKTINDSAAALLKATHEGAAIRVRPERPSPADNKALADRLRTRGLTDADLETITSWRSRDSIPRDKACQIGIALYQSMAALPDEVRGRLMAQAVAGGGWGSVLR